MKKTKWCWGTSFLQSRLQKDFHLKIFVCVRVCVTPHWSRNKCHRTIHQSPPPPLPSIPMKLWNTLRSLQYQVVVFKLEQKQRKSLKKLEYYTWPDFLSFFILFFFFAFLSLHFIISPDSDSFLSWESSKRHTHIYKLTITHCDNLTHKFLSKNKNNMDAHSLSPSSLDLFFEPSEWEKESTRSRVS